MLTEQPGIWWPGLCNELDSVHISMTSSNAALRAQVPRRPSEYLHRNVYIGGSFLSRAEAEAAVEGGYADRIMWGSDYPHMESTFQYPGTDDFTGATSYGRLALRFTFARLEEGPVRTMLGETAAAVYGLDLGDARARRRRHRSPDVRGCERTTRSRPRRRERIRLQDLRPLGVTPGVMRGSNEATTSGSTRPCSLRIVSGRARPVGEQRLRGRVGEAPHVVHHVGLVVVPELGRGPGPALASARGQPGLHPADAGEPLGTVPGGGEDPAVELAGTTEPLDVSVKCDPDRASDLRRTQAAVVEGHHLNKRHWITVTLNTDVPDHMVRELIEDSYDLVASSAPRTKATRRR